MRRALSLLSSIAILLAACSSERERPDGSVPRTDAAVAADSGTEADAGEQLDATASDTGTNDPDAGFDVTRDPTCNVGSWIVMLSGRVLDEQNQGVAGTKVQLCIRDARDHGNFVCLRPVDSRQAGNFDVAIPEAYRCVGRATLRILVPTGRFATTYCEVDVSADVPLFSVSTPFQVFATNAPTTLPPAGNTSQARTVVFDDGLEVDVVPDDYVVLGADPYPDLAGRRIPNAALGNLCFLPNASDVDGVYAFSPEGNVRSSDFALRIPNSTQLAPNTVVDLYVLGGLSCEVTPGTVVEEASWVSYGTATVNASGTSIEGGSLPCFTWLGYKAR